MSEFQCPNCGGYKTSVTAEYATKVPVPPASIGRVFLNILVIYLIIGFVALLARAPEIFTLVAILLVVPSILSVILSALGVSTQKEKKVTGYQFTCNLCGYKWDWLIGDPLPEVKVQPALIAVGAKRLEQQTAAIKCRCGNTIPKGYPYCPYCGTSRKDL
jgi:hypothetical protein